MKIGILGGSFNPIHNGHVMMALTAREKLSLDRVILVPAKHPPHKQQKELAPAEDRLEMTRIAADKYDFLVPSDVELKRREISYAIDTIRQLQREYEDAQIFFIIGADTVKELPAWKDIDELTELCQFVTIARVDSSKEDYECLRDVFTEEKIAKMKQYFLDVEPLAVSATQIRERITRGESISGLVPREVENYIIEKRLYRK